MKLNTCFSIIFILCGPSAWINRAAEPAVSTTAAPVRLSYFRFNNSAWRGEKGELPLEALHVTNAPSYDGGALEIDDANEPALLRYRTVESDGLTNLDCQSGSIRFWYKPFWCTKDRLAPPGYSWGKGPGHWIRLIEVGRLTAGGSPGLFALSINPDGTYLSLQTQDGEGHGSTNVEVRISFTYPQPGISSIGPRWHEILAMYSPAQTELRVDGQVIAKGKGISLVPPAGVRAQGFTIGSSATGAMQAQGLIDELEIFDRPIGEVERRLNGWVMSAGGSASLPEIRLDWRKAPYVAYEVRRRTDGSGDWTTLATNVVSLGYTDRAGVAAGRQYEYEISTGRLLTGIDLPPVERRGRVLLLVDQTVASDLATSVAQLKTDLIGDGWEVARYDVPRHDDQNWASNPPKIADIKSIITREWNSAKNGLKAVFLIGHVAIPYSGLINPDGHVNRPWPTDGYYGSMQGRWTDTAKLGPANVAGDGKFDQASFPAPPQIAVGRIDFARLPAIYPRNRSAKAAEIELLKQYLEKDHSYRYKQFTLPNRAIVGGFFNSPDDNAIYENALYNGSRWFGFEPGKLLDGDLFLAQVPCLWGFEAGPGSTQTIFGKAGAQHTTAHFAERSGEPPVSFYMLKGSYFGEWNVENNLMRAVLALPNYSLEVVWTRYCRWHFEALAMGDPIGAGLLATQADTRQSDASRNLYLALMGDPTLRLQVTAPPGNLKLASEGKDVRLTWNPSPETGAQYFVYRSTTGLNGTFTRLTPDPVRENSFLDAGPPRGSKLYQVRALQRVVTGSGSFTNLSQAVLAITK